MILGLGISFENADPHLLSGPVRHRESAFLWKNIRYAVLIIFLVAAVITPSPDPWTMCIYAVPMLILYLIGIGVPGGCILRAARPRRRRNDFLLFAEESRNDQDAAALLLTIPMAAAAQQHFSGAKAYEYARQFVAIGPRWPNQPGPPQGRSVLRTHFQHDRLEEDAFTANTPIGPVNMRNFIMRFPGKNDGTIVLATHYETNYWLRNINFVGANDGAATTGLLLALADPLRGRDGGRQEARWLLRVAGLLRRRRGHQELVQFRLDLWQPHLAAKWGRDGTLGHIKAFVLADMIGDKDLGIQRESRFHGLACGAHAAGRKKVWLRPLFLSAGRSGRRRSPAVCRARSSFRSTSSILNYGPQQQLSHTRAGHAGQGEPPQPDDRRRRVP